MRHTCAMPGVTSRFILVHARHEGSLIHVLAPWGLEGQDDEWTHYTLCGQSFMGRTGRGWLTLSGRCAYTSRAFTRRRATCPRCKAALSSVLLRADEQRGVR